jgi:hypothetical protein
MTEAVALPPKTPWFRPKAARPARLNLYPLQWPLLVVGIAFGLVTLVVQDWVLAVCVATIFTLVGLIWRADMLPILPACITFQWINATSGYAYWHNTGVFPGGGYPTSLSQTLMLDMLGLSAIVVGLRIALTLFKNVIFTKTLAPSENYDLRKVVILTFVLFGIYYVEDILPREIWFGAAQIIENVLSLRFVPYFILLVTVFERGKGYGYVWATTAWVLLPGLLTGFSDFKELLLVVIVAALAQWRPWVRSKRQARENRRIIVFGVVGVIFVGAFGLVWSGGVKQQWRDEIWQETVTASPIERMGLFFTVVGRVLPNLDLGRSTEAMAARMSSGTLYFSYVIDRVPRVVPHENGKIFSLAIANATQPRILFPNKANLGGDSWLVRKYAGLAVAGDETGASIGLGYLAEFYIDFGTMGVLLFGIFWGFCGGATIALLARVSPSREVFLALIIGLLTGYFMALDGNFIKLFSGLLQRTLVAGGVIAISGGYLQKLILRRPQAGQRRMSPAPYAFAGASPLIVPPPLTQGAVDAPQA